jgi:hypothetical protein
MIGIIRIAMEAENKVILPVYVSSVKTLADRSLNMTLNTQELTPEQYAGLFQLHGTKGYALLSTVPIDNFNELDGMDLEAMPNGKAKTQSSRIRATLYVIWEQQGKGEEFESFYRKETEAIISKLKMRLD